MIFKNYRVPTENEESSDGDKNVSYRIQYGPTSVFVCVILEKPRGAEPTSQPENQTVKG